MRISASMPLPLPAPPVPAAAWFSSRGCLVRGEERVEVFVGGYLIGSFRPDDRAQRDVLVVGLASDPNVHIGRLAAAFEISVETLRRIRLIHEADGVKAIVTRRGPGGSESKLTPAFHRRLEELFEEGHSVSSALAAMRPRFRSSRSAVGRLRAEWAKKKAAAPAPTPAARPEPEQTELPVVAGARGEASPSSETQRPEAGAANDDVATPTAMGPRSARDVQHLGTWLLIAAVGALGLQERATTMGKRRVGKESIRLAIDAVVAALALGEQCVEGVRRLATACAPALLLAMTAPSPTWTRRTLGRAAQDGGAAVLHLVMARTYLRAAQADAERAGPVFYVDNHLRPYTGQEVLRRGWRMQDKRVRPGASDYYVHDEDGRPVWRLTVPTHGSLTDVLSPIARVLRLALGAEETILLAFDRAGAFPTQLAALRDEGFEFVTYERKPYPTLLATAFTETMRLDGEVLQLCESRINLGGGRGRVRRICVRTDTGRQLNLLAVSERPACELVAIMRGRWVQENGFKRGVERWGANQLDARTVVPYAPDTVIPNPARRRLDRALLLARHREGFARSALARLEPGDAKQEKLEAEIREATAEQAKLEALKPGLPKKAPLAETELAGKLVRHTPEYKLLLDTIRIACANAESDLAGELAVQLPRAAEAKKTLANLLAAPGRVSVSAKTISVTLRPAGTKREQVAFAAMLRGVNRRKLVLPGDPQRRPLRFYIFQES